MNSAVNDLRRLADLLESRASISQITRVDVEYGHEIRTDGEYGMNRMFTTGENTFKITIRYIELRGAPAMDVRSVLQQKLLTSDG